MLEVSAAGSKGFMESGNSRILGGLGFRVKQFGAVSWLMGPITDCDEDDPWLISLSHGWCSMIIECSPMRGYTLWL